jgi:putative transposase
MQEGGVYGDKTGRKIRPPKRRPLQKRNREERPQQMQNLNYPQHKNIRLNPVMYIGRRSYFVTLCCSARRPVFANRDRAIWFIENLRKQSGDYGFVVHAYCVMPDHVHLLVTGTGAASDLLAFLRNLKQTTAHEYLHKFGRALWQKKFYDHILRPRDNSANVALYIWLNPVRKGICRDPRDYPYCGSFVLDWKKAISPAQSWVPGWKKNKTPA